MPIVLMVIWEVIPSVTLVMVSVVLVQFVTPTLMKLVPPYVLPQLPIVTKMELAKIAEHPDVDLLMEEKPLINKFVNKLLVSAEAVLPMPNVVLPILEMPSIVTPTVSAEIAFLPPVPMMVVNLEPLLDVQLLLDFLSVPKNLDNLFVTLSLVDVKIYVSPMTIVPREPMLSLLLEEVPIVKLMEPVTVVPLLEDPLPALPPTVEPTMVQETILLDEVDFPVKPTVEVPESALMKPNVPEMKIALPLVVETIVKLPEDVSLVPSPTKLPLALAMMVVYLHLNLIVSNPPDSVWMDVTLRLIV